MIEKYELGEIVNIKLPGEEDLCIKGVIQKINNHRYLISIDRFQKTIWVSEELLMKVKE
jgi:hypothetical protein